jgi:hypothetical protein
MGRPWKTLLEVAWIEQLPFALNYADLCLLQRMGISGRRRGTADALFTPAPDEKSFEIVYLPTRAKPKQTASTARVIATSASIQQTVPILVTIP